MHFDRFCGKTKGRALLQFAQQHRINILPTLLPTKPTLSYLAFSKTSSPAPFYPWKTFRASLTSLSLNPHKRTSLGSSRYDAAEMNLTNIHEDVGSIPGLAQWIKDPVLV